MEEKETFEEQSNKYWTAVEKRIADIKESQTINHEFELRISGLQVVLCLPKRILEQKRLLGLWQEWQGNQDDLDITEKFYSKVSPLIVINGKRLNLDETDLELGTIDAIVTAYGDFMLRPFSVRSIMKTNSHLAHL